MQVQRAGDTGLVQPHHQGIGAHDDGPHSKQPARRDACVYAGFGHSLRRRNRQQPISIGGRKSTRLPFANLTPLGSPLQRPMQGSPPWAMTPTSTNALSRANRRSDHGRGDPRLPAA